MTSVQKFMCNDCEALWEEIPTGEVFCLSCGSKNVEDLAETCQECCRTCGQCSDSKHKHEKNSSGIGNNAFWSNIGWM
jgi:predicted amidophosphoribosyltransferase